MSRPTITSDACRTAPDRLAGRLALLGLVVGLLAVAPAQAQETAEAPSPEYDGLVLEALAAFDAGRWQEAHDLFGRAHALNPTARTLRTMGMSAYNLGDHILALQHLEGALSDQRKPLTPEQREHVRSLIERSNRQVARYGLVVDPPRAVVTVDGRAPALVGNGELVLGPGRHVLRAHLDGYDPMEQPVLARAGDRASLGLRLQPVSAEPTPKVATAPSPQPEASQATEPVPSTPPKPGSAARTVGWISLGVGAAGAVVFGVAGAMALGQKGDLDAACSSDRDCGPEQWEEVDSYDRTRLVSTIGLFTAGVGLAFGTVLLLTSGDGEEATLQARVGPGSLSLQGRL